VLSKQVTWLLGVMSHGYRASAIQCQTVNLNNRIFLQVTINLLSYKYVYIF